MGTEEMDGVKFALRGALAAADAAGLVDDGSTAAQAASGLDLDLILRKALLVLLKGLSGVNVGYESRFLSFGVVIGLNGDVVLVELEEMSVNTAQSKGVAVRTDEAVDGLGSLVTLANGVDNEGRAMIQSKENIFLGLFQVVLSH